MSKCMSEVPLSNLNPLLPLLMLHQKKIIKLEESEETTIGALKSKTIQNTF